MLKIGDKAPLSNGRSSDDKIVKVKSFVDKHNILLFIKDGCSICKEITNYIVPELDKNEIDYQLNIVQIEEFENEYI